LLSRDEAVAILIAVGRMNQNVAVIRVLIEEVIDGREAPEEDDG
jgi:hypothetical protein